MLPDEVVIRYEDPNQMGGWSEPIGSLDLPFLANSIHQEATFMFLPVEKDTPEFYAGERFARWEGRSLGFDGEHDVIIGKVLAI